MNSPAIIKQRRDTAANWAAGTAQPLYDGQLGLEIVKNAQTNKLTSAKVKVGDGISTWSELPYLSIAALSDATNSTQSGYFGDIYLYDDVSPSHYLRITNSADLTAARAFSLNVNDADRTVSLSGNLTLANNFTTIGNFPLSLTTSAATALTLPASGTLAVVDGNLGTPTVTSINKVAITAPITGSTLTIANGKTLTFSNTLTFSGTDTSSVAFGTGGTVSYLGANNAFTGANTFTNSTGQTYRPAANNDGILLRGRAGGTSGHTVEIVPTTLSASRTLTLADGNTVLQTGTMATTGGTLGQFAATTSAALAGVISDETGTGLLVFDTSPTFTTSVLTSNTGTFSVFNTNATTINAFGAATAISIGAGTGTTTINNNLAVTGNLTINGTTTTVNSTTVTIDDPIFTLGGDTAPGIDDDKDRGIEFRWRDGSGAKVGFFGFDDSAGVFTFIPNATNTSEVFTGTAGNVAFGAIAGTTGTFSGAISASNFSGTSSGTNTGDQNLFSTVAVSGQTSISASTTGTALNVAAGSNISLTTNNTTKTLTINASSRALVLEGVDAATTGNDIGALSGVGLVVDGVTLQTGDRILVKDQTNAKQNGVYVVSSGAWTRAADFNAIEPGKVETNKSVPVLRGDLNAGSRWSLNTETFTTLGNTDLVWAEAVAPIVLRNVGTGINITAGKGIENSTGAVELSFKRLSNDAGIGVKFEQDAQGETVILKIDPSIPIAKGGTGATTAAAAFNGLSPVTALGDLIYGSGTNANTRLAGNTTTVKQFLSQTGTGSASAAPVWSALTKSDVGLGNVENTALSTWAGSANITNLGTVATGTWSGTSISVAKGGTGATDAATARSNLGAAADADVVKLTGDQTNIAGAKTFTGTLYSSGAFQIGTAFGWGSIRDFSNTNLLNFRGYEAEFFSRLVLAGSIKEITRDYTATSPSITLSSTNQDVAIGGALTVTGNTIKSSTGTAITLSGTDISVSGKITTSELAASSTTLEVMKNTGVTPDSRTLTIFSENNANTSNVKTLNIGDGKAGFGQVVVKGRSSANFVCDLSSVLANATTTYGVGGISAGSYFDTNAFSLLNTGTTVINAFGAATNLTMGATTGTTTIRNVLNKPKLQGYWETLNSPTISTGTLTLDLALANVFNVTLNANVTTLTISNTPTGTGTVGFTLMLTADGTARTITWPASVKWAGGTAPTLTSTNNKVDILSFISVNNGTTWFGFIGGQNF